MKEEKAPRQIFGYKEWRETAGKRAKLRAGGDDNADSIEKQAEEGEEWFVRAMGGGRTMRSVPAAKVVPDDDHDVGGAASAAGASAGDGPVAVGKRQRSIKKKKRRKKDDSDK